MGANLPDDGTKVLFSLTHLMDTNDGTPPTHAQMRMRLASNVLVLPVHLRLFVSRTGEPPREDLDEKSIRQMIDPIDVSFEKRAIQAGQSIDEPLKYRVTTRDVDVHLPLDHVFARCGVQFRTASYAEIRQDEGLEDHTFTEAELCGQGQPKICALGDRSRITRAAERVLPLRGIPVFIGGPPQGNCEGDTLGIICAEACGSDTFKRGDTNDSFISSDIYIAITQWNTEGALAHEVGHFLGLEHSNDHRNCGIGGKTPNLMQSAAAHDKLEHARVTEDQCGRVRCLAERWLVKWGLASRGSEVDCPSE